MRVKTETFGDRINLTLLLNREEAFQVRAVLLDYDARSSVAHDRLKKSLATKIADALFDAMIDGSF